MESGSVTTAETDQVSGLRPVYRALAGNGTGEIGVLVLRDGARLPLWRVLPEDVRRFDALLERLTPAEREEVARSLRLSPGELSAFVEGLAADDRDEALLVEDEGAGDEVVAFVAYRVVESGTAAMTLAVAPRYRDRGIARLLLDRTAVLAAHRGLEQLTGTASPENRSLVDLFAGAGFEVRETAEGDRVTMFTSLRSLSPEARHGPANGFATAAFTAASLRPLLYPRSVAVAGASRDPSSVGHRILQGLLRAGFTGAVYPVNPSAEAVASVKAYPSVEAIGEPVDLAVVAVPAAVVPEVVESCARAEVRALVVVSAGFAETGAEGRDRQEALVERVRGHGMRMVGPNCLGLLHTHPDVRMNASFAPDMPPAGSVALCSQSGALGIAIIALARQVGLGLSSFVSVGNKADVAGDDLLEYWEEDPGTDVLLFYLESFRRSRRFARIARRVGRRKPIVVVKSGRTAAGGRAAGSHTAALTGAETAVEALFQQTGIIRAATLQEMFGIARTLTEQPLPSGRRFAVVTNAGGPAILCSDALDTAGLAVEPFSRATRRQLDAFLPDAAATGNPVDMIASADPETYRRAVEVVLTADEVDGLVVIYTPVGIVDTDEVERGILEGIAAAREAGASEKPVLASVVGGEEPIHLLDAEDGEAVPAFPFPEEIGRVAGRIADYADWREREPGAFPEFADQELALARETCRTALEERGEGWLSATEVREVLRAAGLSVAPGGVAASADEAVEIARDVGFPVAVKLASTEIVHKTELDAVKLGLDGPDAIREAFTAIETRLEEESQREAMEGVLVQPMLSGTAEVMAGMDLDPVFGPVLAFGMGGIHVEILRDVAFRVCPLTDRDAAEMVRDIRGFQLLEGYRGHPAADVSALEEALLRLSTLVEHVGEISQIDLNPIFALEPGDGYRIADARIGVAPPRSGTSPTDER